MGAPVEANWPFNEPEDTEVITLERIVRGGSPILLVTHDAEDGCWQFLDGEHIFEEDGEVLCLGEIVQFDPTLCQLADLPAGWYAWRFSPDQAWRRAEGEPPSVPDSQQADLS
jgi:hypothetical protein